MNINKISLSCSVFRPVPEENSYRHWLETIRNDSVEKAYRRAAETAEFAPCPLVEHYLDRFNNPARGALFRRSIEQLYGKVSKLGFILCIETAPYKPLVNERYPDSTGIAAFVRSLRKMERLLRDR